MKVLVLSLLRYSLNDKETGEVKEGNTIYYVSPDVGYDNMDYEGLYPSKCQISDKVVSEFNLKKQKYPFYANLEFSSSINPKGKAIAVLTGVNDIKPLDLFK